ncbi:hypothetical protein Tco_1055475 [Tanacetum coccineum]|uniref:Uncharacterized protein n=1 Tax=Tanacetum coccineum TaxID=301880 RepID=A0ABQ5GZS0_9ASTR
MATHNRTYIALFHTKKIFANMRRQGKDFSGRVSQPSNPINVANEAVNEEPSMQLKELVGFCTKLQQRVLDLEITKVGRSARVVSFDEASLDMAEKGSSTLQKPVTTAGEKLKSARPKTKGMKKKDQISFDEQEAIRLQAEFDEEVRLAREKDEANGKLETLIETVKKQACEQQDQKKAIESTMSTCLYVGREEISLTPATITEMLNKKLQADH